MRPQKGVEHKMCEPISNHVSTNLPYTLKNCYNQACNWRSLFPNRMTKETLFFKNQMEVGPEL